MTPNNQKLNTSTEDKPFLEDPKQAQEKIKKESLILKSKINQSEIKNKKIFFNFGTELKWFNIVLITVLHVLSVYHIVTFRYWKYPMTVFWSFIIGILAGFGVTGGVHRFWSHRAYKAKLPLRIFLMICYAMAGQNSIIDWVKDHRVHHKFSETDADPHNSNRGFFFSHVGWLMMKKHPDVIRKGREIDISDVEADPVVAFSQRYFGILKLLFAFVLPTIVPVYFWNEDWYPSFVSQCLIRYPISLNSTWSVNSFAHIWGNKPYDKKIAPTQNKGVAFFALGEGWHNYHHVFPWDYKASELGCYNFNLSTLLIDLFQKIGWAYDCKEPSKELIKNVIKNRGDGTHNLNQEVSFIQFKK